MFDKDFERRVNDTVAKNLSHMLKLRGMTQFELASRMNVSTATISNWCNGVKLPRMDKIDKICAILQINRSDLIEDKPTDDSSSASSQLIPSVKKIIDIMQELNEEGQDKLLEYGDDLLASGKYIKSCEDAVVAE